MTTISGLSGNEVFCLHRQGLTPGELVIGNSVVSLGLIGSIGAGLKTLAGGEVRGVTEVIHDGRKRAIDRLHEEARHNGGYGVTGVSSELVFHGTNIEFLAIGSCVREAGKPARTPTFSSACDGQGLYCLQDAGFTPKHFVFGNVAYSVGVGGGMMGVLRSLGRGEVIEFSQVFNHTRHLALERIRAEARLVGANAVTGIRTAILPLAGMQEMVMTGTAGIHPTLPPSTEAMPITSDLTQEEMWSLINQGYMPVQLVLSVSVYSLGLVGGITSFLKSFARGEINELTSLIYDARENALLRLGDDARDLGADEVLGVKTYVYNLGGGIIEFLAIGTAVRRIEGLSTRSEVLIPQAIIRDQDTFINTADTSTAYSLGNPANAQGSIKLFFGLGIGVFVFLFFILRVILAH
ncbi:heavy metal-binding domain-containing protein [Uliginosibacterium gangwonense]|uniref:heavy metal-binding domain-containing protein n=1 Tax=Uliginosibacterium gangwonense TaxID=392736 RepID=UPI0003644964|nr:heavy metal-binding domain-containing protein [Uliginosibacterium gangwonense]